MRFRHRLRTLAAVWLTCQIISLALVPVLAAAGLGDDTVAHAAVCTCTGDSPNAACPVHHGHTSHAGHAGSKVCYLRSTSDNQTALLTSLFTVVGLVCEGSPVARPSVSTRATMSNESISFERPVPPDPPPPRA